MKHLLLAVGLLLAPLATWADEPDAALPDVPDGSAGSGGADMTSEENDANHQPCLDSSQCDLRTTCVSGRCVPGPVRNAAGCGGGALGAFSVVGLGLGAVLARRRRSTPR